MISLKSHHDDGDAPILSGENMRVVTGSMHFSSGVHFPPSWLGSRLETSTGGFDPMRLMTHIVSSRFLVVRINRMDDAYSSVFGVWDI
jgi:hypothetical protein